jgi:hypothetical protein
MDQDEFRQVVSDNLVPMLQATLVPGDVPSTTQEALVAYLDPTRLAVKPKRDAGYRLVLTRSQSFTPGERTLAGHFVDELAEVVALEAGEYQPDLLRAVQRRVVAEDLGGGRPLLSILERLETWSSQTYEGQRIVASIGLDVEPAGTAIALDDLWDEPFGPVMTNGFDTLLVTGSDGEVSSFLQLTTGQLSSEAPYRMSELACWASGSRIAAVLNQRGEILLFQRQSLRFARRSGSWHHYVHGTNIARMSPPVDPALRKAIYESCLDVSFARSGGGIGVVDHAHRAEVGTIVSGDDLLAQQATYKGRLLSRIIAGRRFQDLDRRARAELLSLDGAMVLGHTGAILAAGSIIDVPAGSVGGGGRTAAAQRLSTIGLGVKVSQDGTITGYRNRQRIFQS